MYRALSLLTLPSLLLLTGCPHIPDVQDAGESGAFTVGPSGGDFLRGEGVYLSFPQGAVESDTLISVSVIDQGVPEVPNRKRISYGYRISPSSLVFKKAVTIGLPWLKDRVPAGLQSNTFDMRRSSGSDAYFELAGPTPIDQTTSVTANTDRLGLFWLTSPAQPNVSEIKISPDTLPIFNIGDTQQFTAQVLDSGGQPVPDAKIVWTIAAPRVGSVDPNGLFTALAPGQATITATVGSVSANATVLVQGTTVGPTSFVHDNPFPTGNDLYGGAISNGTAVFVGGNATVLTRSATDQWSRLYSAPLITLKAAAGSFPTSGVAVGTAGEQGVLVEVSAASAQPTVTTFATSQPRSVWFDGTYGMAVGDGNDVLIRRNNKWVTEYSPSFESLLSVIGDGTGSFVTVGNLGSLYKYDPATKVWNSLYQTRLSVLLLAGVLVDPAGNEAYAVGANKLWHFASNNWTAINLPATPVVTSLDAMGIIDGKVVVAASKAEQNFLLLYDPSGAGTWTSQPIPAPKHIRGVFGSGSTGYAVGNFGAVFEYVNGTFVERSRGLYGDIADVAVTANNVFAAMNDCWSYPCNSVRPRVIKRGSNGTWTDLGSQPFFDALTSLYARSDNELYAATSSALYVWNGTSWSSITVASGLPSFNDVTFCGTNLWAVGAGGAMFKGNGASGPVTQLAATQSGANGADLNAVFCPNDTNVWVAGDGVLLESRTARGSADIQQATWHTGWSPGPGEAFAFGAAPFGVYWDTSALRLIQQPGGLAPDLISASWGSSADNFYLVGTSPYPSEFSFAVRSNGAQWSLIDPGSERAPTSISGASNSEVWIGTKGGGLLRGVMPP